MTDQKQDSGSALKDFSNALGEITRVVKNRVLYSRATGAFYFVPRARMVDGVAVVLGKKYDITDDVKRYIDEANRVPSSRARLSKPRKKRQSSGKAARGSFDDYTED